MNRPVLFISDLHLDASRPNITSLFFKFLEEEASQARALYILGDLFEFWIGDDDNQPHNVEILNRLHRLADSGTELYFMRGNRDFLAGESFSRKTRCRMLVDPSVIDLFGDRVLVMHGDTLCTEDTAYQAFRSEVRSRAWQDKVLSMPLEERIEYARKLREDSQQSIREKPLHIMDVNQASVEQIMDKMNVLTLIHGHTHRPAVHEFELGNRLARRFVLGDWYEQGSVLVCDGRQMRLETRSLTSN